MHTHTQMTTCVFIYTYTCNPGGSVFNADIPPFSPFCCFFLQRPVFNLFFVFLFITVV